MVNSLTPARPLHSFVDSGLPLATISTPPGPRLALKQAFRKLSVVLRNSKGKRKAIRKTTEYDRKSESLQMTKGIQTDINLNSESFLISFAN